MLETLMFEAYFERLASGQVAASALGSTSAADRLHESRSGYY